MTETSQDRERFKSHTEALHTDKQNLEKVRQSLQEKADGLEREVEKLQAANNELQRQRDNLEDDNEDLTREKERLTKEIQRGQQVKLEHKVYALPVKKKEKDLCARGLSLDFPNAREETFRVRVSISQACFVAVFF